MEYHYIRDYIFLGTVVRFLQDVKTGDILNGHDHIVANIEYLFRLLEKIDLPVTRKATRVLMEGYNLFYFYKELTETCADEERSDKDGDVTINEQEAQKLRLIMNTIRNVLDAESDGLRTYIITEKNFPILNLTEHIHKLFAPDAYLLLPDIAKRDFEDGGRSIAFDMPTASAFHLLRGVESVARHWYYSISGKRGENKTLGNVIYEIRELNISEYSDLLDDLDHIRRNYRNPTQHPEKLYDINEAQSLLSLCTGVINKMVFSKHWKDISTLSA